MADDEKNEKVPDTTPAGEETPATGEASDTTPGAETTAGETPVAETPVAETPVAETPVAETPAAVAEETDAAQAPADDAAAAEPTPEEAAEAAPAAAQETAAASDHDVSDPGITLAAEKKPRSNRHVPRSQRRTRTKTVRDKPATRKPITRTPKPEAELGRRQERRGVVISDKGDKTIVVKVDVIKSHPRYKKVIRRAVKFHAHDEQNTAGVGDTVRIVETRPLSRTKRWRLAEIVEKAR
jgi:small subunit ribosomal protein S17